MNIQQKQAIVEELKGIAASASAMVLLSHHGLTVEESTRYRREVESSGAKLKVVKNTLFSRAVAGTPQEFLTAYLQGPVTLAFTRGDPVALARGLMGVLKGNQKMAIKGGSLGSRPLTEADVKALAALPPVETLKAMLLGALAGVPRKFLGVLQAPAREFVGVLKARERRLSEAG